MHGQGLSCLLDHVENCFVLVEPEIMIWNGHGLERDLLGVLEERVGSPNEVQPVNREQAVLPGHIVGQDEPVVLPLLGKEHVGGVCLNNREGRGEYVKEIENRS